MLNALTLANYEAHEVLEIDEEISMTIRNNLQKLLFLYGMSNKEREDYMISSLL